MSKGYGATQAAILKVLPKVVTPCLTITRPGKQPETVKAIRAKDLHQIIYGESANEYSQGSTRRACSRLAYGGMVSIYKVKVDGDIEEMVIGLAPRREK